MLVPDEHYAKAGKLMEEVDALVTATTERKLSEEDSEATMIAAKYLVACAQVHATLALYRGSMPGSPPVHTEDDTCAECGKLLGVTTLDGVLVPSCDSCGPVDDRG